MTVNQLIKLLQGLSAEERELPVLVSSDPEGNGVHPVSNEITFTPVEQQGHYYDFADCEEGEEIDLHNPPAGTIPAIVLWPGYKL